MLDAMQLLDPALGVVRQETVTLGMSGARVLRMFNAKGNPVAVVKLAQPEADHLVRHLAGEADRLAWLADRGVRVPEVLGSGQGWLAMRVLPGNPASDPWPAHRQDAVIDLLADAARELHATATHIAPFDRSLTAVLEEVRERVAAGPVGSYLADAGRAGRRNALTELENAIGALGDGQQVVSHGDFCLPNVLITPSGAVGFVDVGGAGLADPHSDVADMVRSLRSNLNPQFEAVSAERFLDAYGRDRIDPERLRLHDLVNSFF